MELEQERFEAWLFSQPRDRVIEAGHCEQCFLCNFARDTMGIKSIEVLPEAWWHDDSKKMMLPRWALVLIDLDWCRYESGGLDRSPITCAQMQARYRWIFPETDPVIPQQKPKPQEQHA